MYHDTTISLRTCKKVNVSYSGSSTYIPSKCQLYPDNIIKLDEQNYSGFAVGWRDEGAIVFLQTDNWRISTGGSNTHISKIWDSNFKPVKYRGLNYNPTYNIDQFLQCKPYQIGIYDESTSQTTYRDGDCRNTLGQDMSQGADYTLEFQITYYFR